MVRTNHCIFSNLRPLTAFFATHFAPCVRAHRNHIAPASTAAQPAPAAGAVTTAAAAAPISRTVSSKKNQTCTKPAPICHRLNSR